MSLVKWNREGLLPSFNSLLDDFWGNDFFNRGVELGTTIPAVNIIEKNDKYQIDVAAPGLKKEDINIDLENDVLCISYEKKQENETKEGEKITRKEFSYTSFKRSFQLPESINKKAIAAEYKEGILQITLPKVETAITESKKKIEIN